MQDVFIAIIDDDEEDVELLKQFFKKISSISIHDFSTGEQFLADTSKENLPCLLIVDLNLPDIRGMDLIKQIKSNPIFSSVPIIVFTTSFSRTEQKTCEELQIKLLKKPDTGLAWEEVALMMARNCNHIL
jgi:CheY-like chemotaxis protein